jgi:TonB family protein
MDISTIQPIGGNLAERAKSAQLDSHNFMLRVQSAIGPKSLPGDGLSGRVLVAFSISNEGALMGVRLAKSSGHDRLDRQAMQIVSKAAFPTPPAGMSLIGRTYVSAFTFS